MILNGRVQSRRQALESAGFEADLSMVWSKSGKLYPTLLADILSRDPRPTGLLALTTSDHAIILSILMAMGVDVPRELSYVGWAYSYMSAMLPFPNITCLDDVFQSMAECAVSRLLDRTEDLTLPTERFVAPVRIRTGETCTEKKAIA